MVILLESIQAVALQEFWLQLFFPKDLNQVLCNAKVVFLSGLIFFVVYFYDIF